MVVSCEFALACFHVFFFLLLDIDECDSTVLNICTQLCVNQVAHFACSCQPGYELLDNGFDCSSKACTTAVAENHVQSVNRMLQILTNVSIVMCAIRCVLILPARLCAGATTVSA